MKYLLFSDLHLHRWSYGSRLTAEGRNSRLVKQYDLLHIIREQALQSGAKHVICCGDFFHTHQTLHAEVLQAGVAAIYAMAKDGIEFTCLVGNHDMANRSGSIHTLEWMKPIARVVDKESTFELDGEVFHALPYTDDAERLQSFLDKTPDGATVLLHQGFPLIEPGSAWTMNEIMDLNMVPKQARRLWSGHYHEERQLSDNVFIPGSPMQHTWADWGHEKYFYKVEGDSIYKYDTFRTVYGRMPNFLKVEERFQYSYEPKEIAGNFCRIITEEDFKNAEKIKHRLLELGAECVEVYSMGAGAMDTPKDTAPDSHFSIEELLAEYDRKVNPRRQQVGSLLREGKYEVEGVSI